MSNRPDDDKLDDIQYPPDRPLGVDDRGVTDALDSVDERRRREIPDRYGSGRPDDVGTLVDQAGESGIDEEADAVAMEARRDRLRLDRSVQDLEEVEPADRGDAPSPPIRRWATTATATSRTDLVVASLG